MTEVIDVRVASNGRMVLPRAAREALGVTSAGVVVLSMDGDEVRLTSMNHNIRRAQALYRAHVVEDQSSDAFLQARRLEAARDRAADGGA
jgi:bifunctional DNA-binding transcriptional regulator/antitoxin component of YhaV-PrlF toxin-antitoxin module